MRLILILFFMVAFGPYAYSCNDSVALPFGLIGKNFSVIRNDFIFVSADGDFESEYGDGESRWNAIDNNRNYITLTTRKNIVFEVLVSDKAFSINGIRVGSSFSEVLSAFPEATLRLGDEGIKTGVLDLVLENGKIVIWIDSKNVRNLISKGHEFKLTDPEIKKLKVSMIQVTQTAEQP